MDFAGFPWLPHILSRNPAERRLAGKKGQSLFAQLRADHIGLAIS